MNENGTYVLVHDVGTTGNKTCLYEVGDQVTLIQSALEEYPLETFENGGVEQNPDDWWGAICKVTKTVLQESQIDPEEIRGMAFCAQMQGFIPVDEAGTALRPAMNYMDSRGTVQISKYLHQGLIRIEGMNAFKLLPWLMITGGAAASVKDPLWKYLWLRDNEPEVFDAMYRWMDVKDYLVLRATGEFTFGYDSAHATFLYDTRPGKRKWSEKLCQAYDVDMAHLTDPIEATHFAGRLTASSAEQLGLPSGVFVFGGGGDLSMITLGSGSANVNDTHIYIGTSGWVVATVDKRMTDIDGMIASITGAVPGRYNYISEQETSGRCLQWVRDHLALDEINIYLEKQTVSETQEKYQSLYTFLSDEVEKVEPGAGGVLFTPWLHGNRSPFEDPYARGMFFNLGLNTGKREMIRAVLEGVAFNKRWMLETVERKVPRQETLRFVGGGARSDAWSQILADVTGRTIEVVENPENTGALGAAITCAVGLGLASFDDVKEKIKVEKTFQPRKEYTAVYEKNFKVYKKLYKQNKKLFAALNRPE